MAKKDKNKNSTSKPAPEKKDIYNVKENLKKLRSGTGREEYETKSNVDNKNYNDQYSSIAPSNDYSTISTIDRFEKINDKFSSGITELKETIFEHKENVLEKLGEKVDKKDFKYWIGGVIAGVMTIGGIIYTLSYQEIISDTKQLKENKNETNSRLDKVEIKVEQLEKDFSKKENQNPIKTDTAVFVKTKK